MKKAFIGIGIVVVVVALVAIRIATQGNEKPARSIEEIHAEEGIPVDVVTVRSGEITVLREITGEVSGFRQSTLRASADYKIAEVLAAEGERVRRGQKLIRYDTDVSPDHMARLDQATEAYENAKRLVRRLEPLYEKGAIAESELDAARTQLAIAEADVRNSRLELEVVSPIDGVATLISVRAGDAVEGGDVVAQVAVLDSVRVDADVSGQTVRELRTGAAVLLRDNPGTSAEGGQEIGRLTRVSLGANPDTRLFGVEAVLKNSDRTLKPGFMVTLDVVIDRADEVTIIPRSALLGDEAVKQGGTGEVYAVVDSLARLTTIKVGRIAEDMLEIRAGLRDGDQVVVFGANRLEDGRRVQFHKIDGVMTAGETTTQEEAR